MLSLSRRCSGGNITLDLGRIDPTRIPRTAGTALVRASAAHPAGLAAPMLRLRVPPRRLPPGIDPAVDAAAPAPGAERPEHHAPKDPARSHDVTSSSATGVRSDPTS